MNRLYAAPAGWPDNRTPYRKFWSADGYIDVRGLQDGAEFRYIDHESFGMVLNCDLGEWVSPLMKYVWTGTRSGYAAKLTVPFYFYAWLADENDNRIAPVVPSREWVAPTPVRVHWGIRSATDSGNVAPFYPWVLYPNAFLVPSLHSDRIPTTLYYDYMTGEYENDDLVLGSINLALAYDWREYST